jgi:hypothetical protein
LCHSLRIIIPGLKFYLRSNSSEQRCELSDF